jgi:hypothetical protein
MNILSWAVLAGAVAGGVVAFVGLWWWIDVGSPRRHMEQAIREIEARGQVPPKRPPPRQRRRDDPVVAGDRRRVGDRRRPRA